MTVHTEKVWMNKAVVWLLEDAHFSPTVPLDLQCIPQTNREEGLGVTHTRVAVSQEAAWGQCFCVQTMNQNVIQK